MLYINTRVSTPVLRYGRNLNDLGFRILIMIYSQNTFHCNSLNKLVTIANDMLQGVSGGWAGWAIAHPVFGRIEGAAGHRSHYYLPTQF